MVYRVIEIREKIAKLDLWTQKLRSCFNLETAVRDGKVMQDFDLELFPIGGSHSQMVKGPPIGNDSGSKDCVNLPSPTAVFRFKTASKKRLQKLHHYLNLSIVEKNWRTEPVLYDMS